MNSKQQEQVGRPTLSIHPKGNDSEYVSFKKSLKPKKVITKISKEPALDKNYLTTNDNLTHEISHEYNVKETIPDNKRIYDVTSDLHSNTKTNERRKKEKISKSTSYEQLVLPDSNILKSTISREIVHEDVFKFNKSSDFVKKNNKTRRESRNERNTFSKRRRLADENDYIRESNR